jgi:GcrA cell cycle regulator
MLPNLPDLSPPPRPPGPRAASPWTQERLGHLRRRWKEGARAREIGAELGVTANAVIAKIHRLGIARLSPYGGAPGRRLALKRIPAADRPRRPPRARRRAFAVRRAPLAAALLTSKRLAENARRDVQIPLSQRRALFELGDASCRWPVGDPLSSSFFFCGGEVMRSKPYCAVHCARAYRRPRAAPQRVMRARSASGELGPTLPLVGRVGARSQACAACASLAALRRGGGRAVIR